VAIDHVDPAHAAACPAATNYAVTQFSGSLSAIVVPADGGQSSFSSLGLPPATWPQVSMLDTAFDQTGCLGAKLTFAYAGTAVG
jgi:hypothetical protein